MKECECECKCVCVCACVRCKLSACIESNIHEAPPLPPPIGTHTLPSTTHTSLLAHSCENSRRAAWITLTCVFGVCMGWLRLVRSLKLQVSFAEYSFLQGSFAKETYNFKEPTNISHPGPPGSLLPVSLECVWSGYVSRLLKIIGLFCKRAL